MEREKEMRKKKIKEEIKEEWDGNRTECKYGQTYQKGVLGILRGISSK